MNNRATIASTRPSAMWPSDSSHKERLSEAIDEFYAAVDAGQSIDRERLLEKYADIAEELEDCLHNLDFIQQLTPQLIAGPEPQHVDSIATGSPRAHLGDFRILRELGRGGMGVVYEAEEISLGRRIALKVLPFAAMLDKQQLARFKNEARAAATLDHPNIVAIHSVGAERGVHYYAMQLIEGQSLAETIAAMKSGRPPSVEEAAHTASLVKHRMAADTVKVALPTVNAKGSAAFSSLNPARSTLPVFSSREYYRTIARLGIQAAEALDHAHQNGILHRDIKPANLLLDETGKLWITDFGLARIERDAGMTMTGDLLGTLRYMSPEQALAKRVVIDHRSDIYSLGATLYELLTLQPAFNGDDHQELLRQIAFDEPILLRIVDRSFPPELDTIVRKAMAKDREDRYQSAGQFAFDLRAFLDNKPITAKPPSLASRIVKWSRRHQRLVTTAAAGFVLLSAILAISVARVQSAKTQAIAALEETAGLLYTSDMTLAYQMFENGWSDEAQTILERQLPTERGLDRRGFEWHLLKKLVEQPTSFTLAGHKGAVNELAAFPDRKRLASVGKDGALRIWNVPTHELLRTINLSRDGLESLAVSPNGRYVAAGNTIVYLYDLEESTPPRQIFQSEHKIESLCFTPDGNSLAAGVRYHELCLISLKGEILNRVPCESRVESLEYVPGAGSLLVPSRRPAPGPRSIGFVQIWDGALSHVRSRLDISDEDYAVGITIARSSPCGKFVAAGEKYEARMLIYEQASREAIAATPMSRARLVDLAYSPDGKAIAVGYENGCFEYFRLQLNGAAKPSINRRPLVVNAHQGEVTSVRFVEAASVATSGTDGLIRIWDLTANAAIPIELTDGRLTGLQLSPDGKLLLATTRQEIILFDVERGEVICRSVRVEANYTEPVWSATSDKAVVLEKNAESVVILNRKGRTIRSIAHGAPPLDAAMSPDGLLIAVISADRLQICRADTGQDVSLQMISTAQPCIGFSRDGACLAYGGHNGPITILQVPGMRKISELSCGSGLTCLAFSPNDSIIASGHNDSIIRLWNAQTGKLRAELVGHEQSVDSIAFSPDGHSLLSSADDSAIRIWSADDGRGFGVVYRPVDVGAPILGCDLSLSADGSRLAVGYEKHQEGGSNVLLWSLTPIVGKPQVPRLSD